MNITDLMHKLEPFIVTMIEEYVNNNTNTGVSGAGGGGVEVEDEGASLGVASILDFVGAGVTAGIDGEEVTVTIPSGGGYTEGARVYNSNNIEIPNTTLTLLTFDSERWDTDSIHSTVSNTSRLTCQTAGIYLVGFSFYFNIPGTPVGARSCRVYINGTTPLIGNVEHSDYIATGYTPVFAECSIADLGVGDYVVVKAYHNQGAALDIIHEAQVSPEFWMQRIG